MKKLFCGFLTLLLALTLGMPILAADAGYVLDEADILTDREEAELSTRAEAISKRYDCGTYIMTVADYREYDPGDVYEAAKNAYRQYNLGEGPDKSGVMLFLSMDDRDYYFIAYGYGNTAFTDYGKEQVEEEFLDDFRDNRWADGFTDYLNSCESLLQMAEDGEPLDVGNAPGSKGLGIFLSLILGCGISMVVCLILRSKMRSVAVKSEAGSYVVQDSIRITNRQDQFTHRTRTERKIEKSSDSGGTSVGSDGFSGSGGKF